MFSLGNRYHHFGGENCPRRGFVVVGLTLSAVAKIERQHNMHLSEAAVYGPNKCVINEKVRIIHDNINFLINNHL